MNLILVICLILGLGITVVTTGLLVLMLWGWLERRGEPTTRPGLHPRRCACCARIGKYRTWD